MMNARLYTGTGKHSSVALVFIHGFLGCGQDWHKIVERCSDYTSLTVDLPAHGASGEVVVEGFSDLIPELCRTLKRVLPAWVKRVIVVGYSLGGRVAMMLAHEYARQPTLLPQPMAGLVIEAGHPGLKEEAARAARLCSDQKWATRFAEEPMETVLFDWYRQPLFSDLSDEEKKEALLRRAGNHGKKIAALLRATSLARQPDLSGFLKTWRLPWLYIVGEHDTKFYRLAKEEGFLMSVIPNAGHDTHTKAPEAFCRVLRDYLNTVQYD
ncbi:MAG: 2-succinyl-6-hydroxy-2,4-cyclohexadiene-1-carboxylate synthase [Burkholderiales bacterium]|jgi:2-succinyl-6-hydroxy-2,4-cyclohexadiene-1-carboxylate synthase|nr:2-succinyl-6-hydroxy-2,4-cyclohexadiene-1-carboxylate synthase [Burkholderiales bacterium]